MAWFRELFGLKAPTPAVQLAPGRGYHVEIVGESHYQEALERAAGGHHHETCHIETRAVLRTQDDNPYDHMAVGVYVQGRLVGHLDRQMAREYRAQLPGVAMAECAALIVGGWRTNQYDKGYFGLRLNSLWPPERA